ncbi:uncharacterized protein LOC134177005 [Corticium candelabrum]|uniref:uncharacterized protein LOC134177005 n=1 Tax=Corticium candelabrum TaxID=121492 RepID=UPI002E260B2C|nr:uncharacterized protein LOC134177005 [Corticium candelabrum]XP_062499689.1 uncharacterized protein LOC134177005 [Corticium candelabrum]
MCVVVLPAILLAFIFCLYKKHRSRKDDDDDDTLDFVPGIFKRTTTPQYGYDECDTKPHPGPNSGSMYVNLSGSKRRIRQPSLTLVTLPGECEVKSGSLPLQKVNILSSDYCEKTMEELLQESYVDMKARTSGIVSKLAFIKTMERASPDGSHTPAVVSVTSSKKAGIVDDDKTAQSSPGSSGYAPCASELNDTTHRHELKQAYTMMC